MRPFLLSDACKAHKLDFMSKPDIVRSCSIVDVPLIVQIHHQNLEEGERVEASVNSREKLFITIKVSWKKDIVEGFSDLFNYAKLYFLIQSKHDITIDKPIETLLDELDRALVREAEKQKVDLVETHIQLGRPDILHGHVRLEKKSNYY